MLTQYRPQIQQQGMLIVHWGELIGVKAENPSMESFCKDALFWLMNPVKMDVKGMQY